MAPFVRKRRGKLLGDQFTAPSDLARITGHSRYRNTMGLNKVSLSSAGKSLPDVGSDMEEIGTPNTPVGGPDGNGYRGPRRRRTCSSKYD